MSLHFYNQSQGSQGVPNPELNASLSKALSDALLETRKVNNLANSLPEFFPDLFTEPVLAEKIALGFANFVCTATTKEGEEVIVRARYGEPDDGPSQDRNNHNRSYQKESIINKFLGDSNVQIPKIIAETDECNRGVETPLRIQIMSKEDGLPATKFFDKKNAKQHILFMKELGSIARKIHSIPVKGYGKIYDCRSECFTWNFEQYSNPEFTLNKLKALQDEGLVDSKNLNNFPDSFRNSLLKPFEPRLVHMDLNPANLLTSDFTSINSVLDWDNAAGGNAPIDEIARIRVYWLHWHGVPKDDFVPIFESFLEGYGLTNTEYQEIKFDVELKMQQSAIGTVYAFRDIYDLDSITTIAYQHDENGMVDREMAFKRSYEFLNA